jgi:hypothetical protein
MVGASIGQLLSWLAEIRSSAVRPVVSNSYFRHACPNAGLAAEAPPFDRLQPAKIKSGEVETRCDLPLSNKGVEDGVTWLAANAWKRGREWVARAPVRKSVCRRRDIPDTLPADLLVISKGATTSTQSQHADTLEIYAMSSSEELGDTAVGLLQLCRKFPES